MKNKLFVVDSEKLNGFMESILQEENGVFKDMENGLTLEELKEDRNNPNLIALTEEELDARLEEYHNSLITGWTEISADDYDVALNGMPPLSWADISSTINIFFLQEFTSGPITTAYAKVRRGNNTFFLSSHQNYYKRKQEKSNMIDQINGLVNVLEEIEV